jgi:hypothetical protein
MNREFNNLTSAIWSEWTAMLIIGITEFAVWSHLRRSRIRRGKILHLVAIFLLSPAFAIAQAPPSSAAASKTARYDGEDWHVQGEGVVCCPCAVPCPCRTNSSPTYGHCEATLYLHVREGHYGKVNLESLRMVDTSGSCGMSYEKLAALYFDSSVTPEVQDAFVKLLASLNSTGTAAFPYLRTVPIDAVEDGPILRVTIPDILEMIVDRSWGHADSPLPDVAAVDRFGNTIRYVQNLRYRIHDAGAKLDFDYSRRQANYRAVDLDIAAYRSHSMLVQFRDGAGWFNPVQLRLINEQHLRLPDLKGIGREVSLRRRLAGGATAARVR